MCCGDAVTLAMIHRAQGELSGLQCTKSDYPDHNKAIRMNGCLTKGCRALVLACLLAGGSTALAEPKTVRLTSLEWPPYAGAELPDQGASVVVVREAFKAMGYGVQVDFFPWSTAISKVTTDIEYSGYFPEYLSKEVSSNFHCAGSIGNSPLAFAQRRDKPIAWKSLDDLSTVPIGVVQDYVNTEAFDARVAQNRLKAEISPTDTSSLLKLELNRIDLAVIDSNVFDYLRQSVPQLKRAQGSLELNPKILEMKKLFVCFKRTPEGLRWSKLLSEGLRKIDVEALSKAQLQRGLATVGNTK
jgi:polar amino acid transport system substrate-binding protein